MGRRLARLRFGFSRFRGGRYGDNAVGALDAGCFALEIAKVVQAGAANLSLSYDFDGADRGRMERKNALDADAEADASHGEGSPGRAAFFGDDHAFKSLQPFFFLFAFA